MAYSAQGQVRQEIIDRWNGYCALCLKKLDPTIVNRYVAEAIEIDHDLPVAKGGSNDINNLQPVHKACNLYKRSNPNATQLEFFVNLENKIAKQRS